MVIRPLSLYRRTGKIIHFVSREGVKFVFSIVLVTDIYSFHILCPVLRGTSTMEITAYVYLKYAWPVEHGEREK